MISQPNKWGVVEQYCSTLLTCVTFLILPNVAQATHSYGAEFRYTALSNYTYQIELVHYGLLNGAADNEWMVVEFGDGSVDTVFRTGLIDYMQFDLRVSYFESEHTYPSNGTFTLSCSIPNRSAGIINIPNSVTEPLSVDALIVIDPVLGMNNSIRFDSLQTNWYMAWNTLVHEPGSYEADSDSVVYELVTPLGLGNAPIPGYADILLFTSNYVWLNPSTGRLLWNQPTLMGEYVIAIRGTEYRNGQLIGQVTRDVQVQVLPQMLMVGVAELETSEPLIIQPSLASSEIQFDSGSAGNRTAQLFNATGAMVSTLALSAGMNIVTVSDLDPGIYVLRIRTSEGNTRIGQFIKE